MQRTLWQGWVHRHNTAGPVEEKCHSVDEDACNHCGGNVNFIYPSICAHAAWGEMCPRQQTVIETMLNQHSFFNNKSLNQHRTLMLILHHFAPCFNIETTLKSCPYRSTEFQWYFNYQEYWNNVEISTKLRINVISMEFQSFLNVKF